VASRVERVRRWVCSLGPQGHFRTSDSSKAVEHFRK
jgi:hypothetical protein